MQLPDLFLQFVYGRLAWGIVFAAVIVALWPRRFVLSRAAIAVILTASIAVQALPGAASPAYWMALAFQWPSALLVGLCLAKLYLGAPNGANERLLTPAAASLIAVSGAALYLDAIGIISVGFFYWGFGPYAAPALALLLAVGAAVALARGQARPRAFALLLATLSFAILRLPTGNLWDALLDPLLWGWALVSLAGHGRRRWSKRRRAHAGQVVPNNL